MADTIYKTEDRPAAEKITALIKNMAYSEQTEMLTYIRGFRSGVEFAKNSEEKIGITKAGLEERM